jgi:hypothetical protein
MKKGTFQASGGLIFKVGVDRKVPTLGLNLLSYRLLRQTTTSETQCKYFKKNSLNT